MAVNIVLTAILRANISQFLSGMAQAAGGVGTLATAAKALQAAFDVFLMKEVLEIIGAIVGTVRNFIAGSLEANSVWEQQKAGLAAILMESNNITDVTGKQLSLTEKYERSLGISAGIMEHLQIMAAEGVGTTKEYVDAFSGLAAAVSNSLKPGDDAVKKTQQLTQAVVAASHILGQGILKGGQHQAVREINQLLEGRLTRINTLALDLGIFNDKKNYQAALKTGKVFDYIMSKMEAFRIAQGYLRHTFAGLQTTIQDIGQIAQRIVGESVFASAKDFMQTFVDKFFVKGADGVDRLNEGFIKFLRMGSGLLDEFLKPMRKTLDELMQLVIQNKDVAVDWLRTFIQLSGLVIDIINLILSLLRLVSMGMVDIQRLSANGLTAIIASLRAVVQLITDLVDRLNDYLRPAFQRINEAYNQYLRGPIESFLKLLHLNGDATKAQAARDKEAADAAKSKATAIGHTNDELGKQNKLVQDNTQHWRNWVSLLKAAYMNRVPQVAKSFLTSFGSAGTLSPFAGSGAMADVNININTPDGHTITVPAKMTPQQIAQSRTAARQTAGVMHNMQRRTSISPSVRTGPVIQPA